jgi:hypothetical protein
MTKKEIISQKITALFVYGRPPLVFLRHCRHVDAKPGHVYDRRGVFVYFHEF